MAALAVLAEVVMEDTAMVLHSLLHLAEPIQEEAAEEVGIAIMVKPVSPLLVVLE